MTGHIMAVWCYNPTPPPKPTYDPILKYGCCSMPYNWPQGCCNIAHLSPPLACPTGIPQCLVYSPCLLEAPTISHILTVPCGNDCCFQSILPWSADRWDTAKLSWLLLSFGDASCLNAKVEALGFIFPKLFPCLIPSLLQKPTFVQ